MSKAITAFLLALLLSTTMTASSSSEADCLARTVYHEARGSSRLDERAVAHVVINRKNSPRFPRTICGVIQQPGQFTWFRSNPAIRDSASFNRAKSVARDALNGTTVDPTDNAKYFWRSHLRPSWGRRMTITLRTEDHIYAK